MKSNQFFRKEIKILSQGIMKSALSLSAVCLLAFTSCSKDDLNPQNPDAQNANKKTTSGIAQGGATSRYDSGYSGGYFWSLYQDGGGATFSNGSGGNFSIGYQNVNDVVGGKGWRTGSSRNIGYNVGALSGSYNFVGVYGWTTNPLIEYYVAERGSVAVNSYINTIYSDGHNYNVYKHLQVNQPSIIGTATFWQYQDVWGGAGTGSNRNINMANHINNWRSRGGQGFGNHDYQVFGLEAYGNKSGYINATVW
jgi:endo-1,4-beta-xylanase